MDVTTKLKWDGDIIKIRGKKLVNKSAFEIGLIIEGYAKNLAPVKTGRLAASISTQSNKQGSASGADTISKPLTDDVVLVGTPVQYAPYMEYGTIRASAQPFLRPALDLAKGRAVTIINQEGKYIFGDYLK